MVQVLKQLPWEEEELEDEASENLLGQTIRGCRVFHAKGNSGTIHIVLELSWSAFDDAVLGVFLYVHGNH